MTNPRRNNGLPPQFPLTELGERALTNAAYWYLRYPDCAPGLWEGINWITVQDQCLLKDVSYTNGPINHIAQVGIVGAIAIQLYRDTQDPELGHARLTTETKDLLIPKVWRRIIGMLFTFTMKPDSIGLFNSWLIPDYIRDHATHQEVQHYAAIRFWLSSLRHFSAKPGDPGADLDHFCVSSKNYPIACVPNPRGSDTWDAKDIYEMQRIINDAELFLAAKASAK